jgi:hypothetical protein
VADRNAVTEETRGLAMAERISWIAQRFGGQRELAREAFGDAASSRIGAMLTQLRAGKQKGIDNEAALAIVRAAARRGYNVRLEWLVSGEEPRIAIEDQAATPVRVVEYDDPYPNRPPAIAALQGIVDAEVLTAMRSMATKTSETLTTEKWIDVGRDLQRHRNRVREELAAPQTPLPAPRVSPADLDARAKVRKRR